MFLNSYSLFFFRRELRPFGVKIAIVEPGYFRTGMTNVQWALNKLEQIWINVPQETKDSYGQTYFDNCNKSLLLSVWEQCDGFAGELNLGVTIPWFSHCDEGFVFYQAFLGISLSKAFPTTSRMRYLSLRRKSATSFGRRYELLMDPAGEKGRIETGILGSNGNLCVCSL